MVYYQDVTWEYKMNNTWQQLGPLPPRKANSFLSFSFFPLYFSTCCFPSLFAPEKYAWIISLNCTRSRSCGEQHVIQTSTDRKWVLPHFLSTNVTLLAAWCLQFSLTATSVLLFSLLTYARRRWWAKRRTRDNSKLIAHITPTDGGSTRATSPQAGNFPLWSVSHTHSVYLHILTDGHEESHPRPTASCSHKTAVRRRVRGKHQHRTWINAAKTFLMVKQEFCCDHFFPCLSMSTKNLCSNRLKQQTTNWPIITADSFSHHE